MIDVATPGAVTARRVRVRGVVQGVGFRPFVYGLASELGLVGEVANDADGVIVRVQGGAADVEAFCHRVRTDAPRLSLVESVEWRPEPVRPGAGFTIAASTGGPARTLVPPDVATCDACLAELADPADRRYRHPFISCTACGPRFTIITGLPYDRSATTMAPFALCARCHAEYTDPADRRFHAQPIACHDCGPVLELVPGGARREQALAGARALLAAGRVVAVKGLGGYHLACDAANPDAVRRLRGRKRRGDKPFALLVPDLDAARAVAEMDVVATRLLTSARRPIVLLRRRPGSGALAAAEVAPGNADLGLMLPPTALHHLLLGLPGDSPGPRVLVLTSANLSGEPIVTDDDEAVDRLAGLADAWLRHDRAIHLPCDDSVLAVVDGEELPVRRSRGYAPMPLSLPVPVRPTLAVGGDLKNTFCLARDRYAWLSAHVGDMGNLVTQQVFERATGQLAELVSVEPEILVTDAHPGYHSAAWARRSAESVTGLATGSAARSATRFPRADELVAVQHHHAHIAAVMAEHGLDGTERVIGVALDGTGYGPDGAVWGGEVLIADYDGFRRYAHLGYVPLPGGDAAVRRPYRMALAHLWSARVDWDERLPCVAACEPTERATLTHQLERGLGCVPTSSAGRLFDAVSALTGVRQVIDYEAQAATELQALAVPVVQRDIDTVAYPMPLAAGPAAGGPAHWDAGVLVRAAAGDVLAGVGPGVVAARFHRGLAAAVVDVALRARADTGLMRVALSGGVFANALLLRLVSGGLAQSDPDVRVLRHRHVPPNDGGLALGQVLVGGRAPVGGRVGAPAGTTSDEGASDVSGGARQSPRDRGA